MMGKWQLIISVMVSYLMVLPAEAQRLVSKLSAQEISINSTFAGESLTMFGNVEPPIGANGEPVEGPFEIIIVVQGPPTQRIVRQKTSQLGIWLNSKGVVFSSVPTFYHILATSPIDKIASVDVLEKEQIGLIYHAGVSEVMDEDLRETFANQLVRLMSEAEMFGVSDRRVSFLSETFYNARMILPANVPNGTYLAKTYLFKDGEILDQRAERFFVRTTGAERFIGNAARDFPLIYGLVSVLIALLTGWLGAVAFRR